MTQATKKITEIVSVKDVNIGYFSLLPAEYDGHELDKYRDGDVGRADVGQKQEDRLGEQLVAVLHGGEDNHVEDGDDNDDLCTMMMRGGVTEINHFLRKMTFFACESRKISTFCICLSRLSSLSAFPLRLVKAKVNHKIYYDGVLFVTK